MAEDSPILEIDNLSVAFGPVRVIDGLSFSVKKGEILGVIGPSGSGKSVTLRAIVGLLPMAGGAIKVFGKDYAAMKPAERLRTERRWGVLFQQGALFSALTVLENIEFPMREHFPVSPRIRREVARYKIDLVGLPAEAAYRYPSELSGGMIKRAALARSLALDPDILFLDEPTAGLDPIGAAKFDELVVALRDTLGLTVYMVTHDLDTLAASCDRIAALGKGRLLAIGTMNEMLKSDDPWLNDYFKGPRARHLGTTRDGK
ncbi:ABC transporter ATP-binding protein [Pelagibacterium limicola]|uniref:ABC transporter ATP-binding protein n=1 Tax=Pelagibacterium limicola TaxID=2791022 RepID=UPI0018AFC5C6|nr:ATP-binding cassette domain-containing protein [Pelagibacterium limicola]